MSIIRRLILAALIISIPLAAYSEKHEELGDVDWLRNYDEALAESKKTGKPILILFQEVPGCAGCVQFGQETLTHQLIVDAIESEFVPLAIRNNTAFGHDREILNRFNEPSWNYQVMRFVDAEGNDIIPRRDRIWTPSGTANRMIEALDAFGRAVPENLYTVAGSKSAQP